MPEQASEIWLEDCPACGKRVIPGCVRGNTTMDPDWGGAAFAYPCPSCGALLAAGEDGVIGSVFEMLMVAFELALLAALYGGIYILLSPVLDRSPAAGWIPALLMAPGLLGIMEQYRAYMLPLTVVKKTRWIYVPGEKDVRKPFSQRFHWFGWYCFGVFVLIWVTAVLVALSDLIQSFL